MFEGGEEALHHGVVSAAALGLYAAPDLAAFQQLPVGRRSVLAPLIGMNQELVRFDVAMPQSQVEGLQHQRGLHCRSHHPSGVQIDLDSQVPPPRCGAEVGDVAAQQRLGAVGLNSCCSRLSATPKGLLPLLRQRLNPRQVVAFNEAVRISLAIRCRTTLRPVALNP